MSSNGIGGGNAILKIGPAAAALVVVSVLIVAGLSRIGCANHHTPPGHEGYIKSKPLVGAGAFVGTQHGPKSTGWVWRQNVVNIDFRPRTFSEEMSILTSNRLELAFRAHGRVRLRRETVREVVENFGGENWYENNVRKQFRSVVRDQVQRLEPFEVKDKMGEIGDAVLATMRERYKDTPVDFLSVDIGDIQYPQVVVDSVIRKFVTAEDNERKDVELKIAQKQIEIGIAEARGIADAQKIIRTTLDPMFLQFEALNAMEELAGSSNTTFMVMPFSKNGNAPIILSID